MLYHLHEMVRAALNPALIAANSTKRIMRNPYNPLAHMTVGRGAAAAAELIERTTRQYAKPEFGIGATTVAGRNLAVRERIVWQKPFCRLIHFHRDLPVEEAMQATRVLVVAPLSGHYATLLRGTVEGLLPFHEVYITDWSDARMAPVEVGAFDLDCYVDYILDMIRLFKGDVHVMAVCQPSVPVMMAVSYLEAIKDAAAPRSMILLGGPIDTRVNPTAVNKVAVEKGIDWFRQHVVTAVPWPYPGQGRKVYPGFLQLISFISMNMDRHVNAHKDLFFSLVNGDGDSAEKHREFYNEYLAVMDLTAEFYLQTVEKIFIDHSLPKGQMFYRGHLIDPGAVRRVALMTVEGEKDDITGVGQCHAAHLLCRHLSKAMKKHHLQAQAGHYGIFNGSRFRSDIVPAITAFIQRHDLRAKGILRRIFGEVCGVRRIEMSPHPIGPAEVGAVVSSCPASPGRAPKAQMEGYSTDRKRRLLPAPQHDASGALSEYRR